MEPKTDRLKFVLTGGGTGGHVYPNIAIYESLKEQFPDSSFLYIGTRKGAERKIIKGLLQPIDFVSVPSKGLPSKMKSFKSLISLMYILGGAIKSFLILRKFKPDVIIGSGGYVSAPVLFAAAFLKSKVFIHEQNAVPGRLNRLIARFATKIGVSFSSTAQFFPEKKVSVTGYPLRKSIVFQKGDNSGIKKKYKIPKKNKVLFIFGGSSGAKTINDAVADLIPDLVELEGLSVILATGRGYSKEYRAFEDTMKLLGEKGISSEIEGRLIIREYFDNIDEIYSISDLIVCRAGAGTIKEITTLGIPSILIPKIDLPGDHQILNAREIEKINGGRIVYEEIIFRNGQREIQVPQSILLNTIKEVIFGGDILFNMRRNLRQIEKKNSAQLILTELMQILEGSKKLDEKQIRIVYLHSPDTERNIELIFDSTKVGNSVWADIYLDDTEDELLLDFRIIDKDEKLILKRLKGNVAVNGVDVDRWIEIKEDDVLVIGNVEYTLKSYTEKVKQFQYEKKTTAKIWGSSMGIMISRVGGLFREIIVSAIFGARGVTDIFFASLTVSNLMRRVVAENALENAFLPIYLRMFHRMPRKKMWEASSSVVNFTLILSLFFTVLGIIFAPIIIKTFFYGFVEKGILPEMVKMTRLMFPYLFLITVAAVLATYLKAFSRFGIAELSAVFFSVGTISGILIFQSSLGMYSLAYGVLMGGVLQILFLFPFIRKIFKNKALEFSYQPFISIKSPVNKKYYSQLAPVSMDVIISKVAEVVDFALASRLATGSISYLYYAKTIFRLPFAIISQAINTVVLRDFSKRIALFEKEKAKRLFLDGIKTNLFILAPISILMIVLAEPIVALIYGRGQFEALDVSNSAFVLKFYALGLIGWAIHSLTSRIFAARLDIKTSMMLNFVMLGVNVGLCIILVQTPLRYAGLALATSISYLTFSVIRVIVLRIKLARDKIVMKYSEILISFLKTITASLLMFAALVQARYIFKHIQFFSYFFENLFTTISLLFIGSSVYLLTSLMLKNTEILIFRRKLMGKAAEIPLSMLPPSLFLERVSKNPSIYKDDFLYKIHIYVSSGRWEIRNIGIKLIGLFKDEKKVNFLISTIKSKKTNGFVRRNAVNSLKQIDYWTPATHELVVQLMDDPYYEVRTAALGYIFSCGPSGDLEYIRGFLENRFDHMTMEEKLVYLKVVGKVGTVEDLERLKHLYLSSNSLVREELLEVIHGFYRRRLISADEVKLYVQRVLMTSNHMDPEFKLKSIMKKIYKEIDQK